MSKTSHHFNRRALVRKREPESLSQDRRQIETYISIRRPVDVKQMFANPMWQEFLDSLLEANSWKGFKPAQPKNMGVTYINSGAMRKMLNAKYPRYGLDLRATREIHEKTARQFRAFARVALHGHQDKNGIENIGTDFKPFETRSSTQADVTARKNVWGHDVASVMPYCKMLVDDGKVRRTVAKRGYAIVLDLNQNDWLREEQLVGMRDFLRSEGLNSSLWIPSQELHISVMHSSDLRPRGVVNAMAAPNEIPLLPVAMTHEAFFGDRQRR